MVLLSVAIREFCAKALASGQSEVHMLAKTVSISVTRRALANNRLGHVTDLRRPHACSSATAWRGSLGQSAVPLAAVTQAECV